MPSRSGKEHDFTVIARKVVEQAIGEQLNGKPLTNPNEGKNPKAISRGRIGGLRGGPARAKKLSAKRKKQIAKKAAKSRWKKS
jgi:hypothetical protein